MQTADTILLYMAHVILLYIVRVYSVQLHANACSLLWFNTYAILMCFDSLTVVLVLDMFNALAPRVLHYSVNFHVC